MDLNAKWLITQAKDYQNLKVDTLRVQNNYELKSSAVEFFHINFCLPPPGFELKTPDLKSSALSLS